MSIPVYIVKRILISIPTLIIISMIGFLLMRFDFTVGPIDLPGVHILDEIRIHNPIDPLANLRNNPAISRAALVQETHRIGLDQPMHVQYWRWVTSLLSWPPDLGKTFSGDDVTWVIMLRAGNTLMLNVLVLAISWLVAIPIGIYAALHWRSGTDRTMTILAALGMSLPSFVVALLMAVLAVKTGLFPLGGIVSENFDLMNPFSKALDILRHLTLPAIVLTIGGLSSIQRQMRGNLLDVLAAEYVRTARAKGLPENKVIYRHAVRTAINPLVTLMGYELSALLGGSILVETVLNFPGLGQLMYKAVLETDTNLVMTSLLMSAALLVLGNLLADILLKFVDPRIELS